MESSVGQASCGAGELCPVAQAGKKSSLLELDSVLSFLRLWGPVLGYRCGLPSCGLLLLLPFHSHSLTQTPWAVSYPVLRGMV